MTLGINGSEAAATTAWATTVAADRAAEPGTAAGGTEAESLDWKRCHDELVRLAALRASLDWDEGRMLLLALRSGAHLKLAFAAFVECRSPGSPHPGHAVHPSGGEAARARPRRAGRSTESSGTALLSSR